MKNEQKRPFEDNDLVAFVDNGIFFSRYKVELLTLEIAKKSNNCFRQMSQGKALAGISDIRKVRKIDNDAREFLSSKEACELVSAGAIIVNSVFQKIAGNFFILINKPAIPAKIFTDEQEAIKWLEKFKAV